MKRHLIKLLLPFVDSWARKQEKRILTAGEPLSPQGLEDAAAMGVSEPDKVRVLAVDEVPMPGGMLIRLGSKLTGIGLASPGGMSLGRGIFVRRECAGDRWLIAHECVHAAQYERLGGLTGFLEQYLLECWIYGYPAAPLEREAVETTAALRARS